LRPTLAAACLLVQEAADVPNAFAGRRNRCVADHFELIRRDRLMANEPAGSKQLLHLVFGGELTSLQGHEFKDLNKLDLVGIYPNYATAYVAWKAKAQQTVDNAHMRYFIVHMHRLMDPETEH
jgi:hypothetical protein